MIKTQKQMAILNLSGELSAELTDYFASRNVQIASPSDQQDRDWTHIIVKDLEEFDHLNTLYDLVAKDRFLISLSRVGDMKNFAINNGNLVLNECWMNSDLGSFILDKYFQSYGGITLADNYPKFNEAGSFNIANPFNTGEYLDRMVQKAFEAGSDALSVKSYFDHLLMFVTGLKNKGKAGLPFEVIFGTFESVFAVQIHFFAQNLDISDLTTGLNSGLSKKPEEYFLNVAVQSADFFDCSYMPDVSKIVITSLWINDERIKFENRGFMFSTITGGSPVIQYSPGEEVTSFISAQPEIMDFSEKISASAEDEELPAVVSGSPTNEETEAQVVKGRGPEEEASQVIKGSKELEELVQTIKGNLEQEDNSVFTVSGEKFDIDKTALKIAGNVQKASGESNLTVKSLGPGLQKTIKSGLFDFAKGLNKEVDDLEPSDLAVFQMDKVPELLKRELENKMISSHPEEKSSLTVKASAQRLSTNQSDAEIKDLQTKLVTANADNEKLKSQMKTLASEVRILKESRNKLAEIQAKAQAASVEINLKQEQNQLVDNESHELINKINQKLDEQDVQKITVLMDTVKQEELKVRKLQLEAVQKDTFFSQQMEKSERDIKSKDLIIIKTKETFTKLVDKKDREISELKIKIDQLGAALVNNPASNNNQIIKDLERQNQNLNKQIDMYKVKISSMATNLQPSKSEDSLKEEARKLQMLNQQMKNQLAQNQRELEKLQSKDSIQSSQLQQLKQEKAKLDQLFKKATQDLKEATVAAQSSQNDHELKRLLAQNQVLETQVKDSAQKISNLEAKLTEALKPQKGVISGDDGSKVKLTQLENSVKKLTQDLIEAKNQIAESKKETNKLRQDKTALQNQLDKLKKEADKQKSASPKKPGGKAA